MSLGRDIATDGELVRASIRDPAAFEALFERRAAPMRDWLARQVGDVAIANDLVAETFAEAWHARRRFSGEQPDAGTAWLYGIARNLLKQHYRRGRVETAARRRLRMSTPAPHDDDLDAILARVDAQAQHARLDAALDALPLPQRQAIDGRVVRDLAYDQVAVELHCDPQSARARVSRGLRSLKSILNGEQ